MLLHRGVSLHTPDRCPVFRLKKPVVHFSSAALNMPGMKIVPSLLTILLACLSLSGLPAAQTAPSQKVTWKSVQFAIVRFNDQAPNSWSIYHSEKKGVLLVRLWKRYMLVKIQDEEVYDIDPQKISVHDDSADWSYADIPDKPLEVVEWKERNIGSMQRVTFRFGKNGHVLELQIPLGLNREPLY